MLIVLLLICAWASAIICVYLANELGKLRSLLTQAHKVMAGQHLIIQVMLRKGIEVRCDWCHNPMAPNVSIEVVEQEDGSVWVQHASHGVG